MTLDRATRRQRQVLVAYLKHGSYKAAANELGINENTARTRIGHLLRLNGWHTVAQAAYQLGKDERAA